MKKKSRKSIIYNIINLLIYFIFGNIIVWLKNKRERKESERKEKE